MHILVDDQRNLDFVDIIFRNAGAFEEYFFEVKNNLFSGMVGAYTIILDHDLGEGATGADCLNLLRDSVIYNTISCFPTIGLISSNPVGRAKMRDTLIYDMGYKFLIKTYYGAHAIDYYNRS